ncbi:MAG: flavodoxin family protein [Clostridiales bacterium]|nr:flavodoxin family protein [Clostridiales bacterium]
MKITILNGSPRKENTAAMAEAFAEGAREAGHEVEILQVGKMKINGCLGCEYCHTKGEGKCVQKDDMDKVIPAYMDSDMLVFATPVYYFDMTAQLAAAIQRVYCIGKPAKATKAAMLISSGSPGTGEGAAVSYKNMLAYMGIEDAGVCALAGEECKSEEKLAEIRAWAKSL